ncbi:MAG: hypothetical protein ABIQ39_04805 [Ilumatobacteraceae bacterium]
MSAGGAFTGPVRVLMTTGLVAIALVSAGCSSSAASTTIGSTLASAASVASPPSSSPPGSTVASPPGSAVASPPLRIDLIEPAVQALEAKLGGPQQYFEINATAKLVNLIIAANNATLAQNWVYLDGALASKPAQAAQGHTFAAAALTFDTSTVLGQVAADLPGSSRDLFVVEGASGGAVRLTVVVSSVAGGQLLVVIDQNGKVLSVTPN